MTWITGTATDFKDLLSQINSNAVAHGWTQERYTTGGSTPNTDELILKGPGFGVGYEVYFGLRTYESNPNNEYCFEVRGFTAFDNARLFEMQLNTSPMMVMRLWNASITFWLSVTDRRIALVAKCSNTYHSLYAGFMDPFSDPTEYPYPMYIGTDSNTYGAYGAVDIHTQSMAAPGLAAAWLRDPAGNWKEVAVTSPDGLYGFQGFNAARYTMWPYNSQGGTIGQSLQWSYPPTVQFEPLPGTTDTLPMMNIYIMACFNKGGVLGVLEGVLWVPGNALSAEQIITDANSNNYKVFIAISRSIESPTSYYAFAEV